MTFKEIQNEDYTMKLFNLFMYTTALNNRKPYKAILYDIDELQKELVVFSQSTRGCVITRHFKLDKDEMFFFLQWLGMEFPSIDFIEVED